MRRWWETIMPRILVSPVAAATRTYNENLEFKTTGTPATPSSSSRSRDPASEHLLEWALRTRIGCDDTESREGPESRAAVPVGGGRAWRASSHTSAHQAPLVWRAPEGPEGTGGLRGAAPNKVRSPSLAGDRALRRPEHPRGSRPRGGSPPTGTYSSPARRTAHAAPGTPMGQQATRSRPAPQGAGRLTHQAARQPSAKVSAHLGAVGA